MKGLLGSYWIISSKWMLKRFDCTPEGIRTKCHGKCCYAPLWPGCTGKDGKCPHLGAKGCTIQRLEDRPITCLLYPLKLNKSRRNTLVVHLKGILKNMPCEKSYGSGPPLIDIMKGTFSILFGSDVYDRLREQVLKGKDFQVHLPKEVAERYKMEKQFEKENKAPQTVTG
jgi:hypothetical protein